MMIPTTAVDDTVQSAETTSFEGPALLHYPRIPESVEEFATSESLQITFLVESETMGL
jgi:hypothetical protein